MQKCHEFVSAHKTKLFVINMALKLIILKVNLHWNVYHLIMHQFKEF